MACLRNIYHSQVNAVFDAKGILFKNKINLQSKPHIPNTFRFHKAHLVDPVPLCHIGVYGYQLNVLLNLSCGWEHLQSPEEHLQSPDIHSL